MRGGKLALAVVIASLVSPFVGRAAPVPAHWRAPAWWLRQAVCIHHYEGAWNATSNPAQRGGMQIAWSTWRSVGGVGDPAYASIREQLYRAWLIWLANGHRWGGNQWPNTSRMCGLR